MKKTAIKIKEVVPKKVNLEQVLLKKATGYKIKETVDEYVVVEEELKLTKRKVNVKYYPPDLNAIEVMLNATTANDIFNNYTDEELEQEKQMLLDKIIKQQQND